MEKKERVDGSLSILAELRKKVEAAFPILDDDITYDDDDLAYIKQNVLAEIDRFTEKHSASAVGREKTG